MTNKSEFLKSGTLLGVINKGRFQIPRVLQPLDETINCSFKEQQPLEKFLIDLLRYCISNNITNKPSIFQTESDLISVTEPIKLEPGTLIVVESRLGWNIEYNDLYFIDDIKEERYLVRDSGDGKAWEYTYEKFWKYVFSRQKQGANVYIMSPNHPQYWTAKVRLGFKPPHQKKEISRVAIEPRKVIREMVDWRDMLNSQDHLIFDNGQQKLKPLALEGYINEIPVDEIENTAFLKASDFEYHSLFNDTIFAFQADEETVVKMSYDELVNQRWVQIEMSY